MVKNRRTLLAALVLTLSLFLLCGCESKAESSLRLVREALTELAPEETKITASVLDPLIMTRAPLTVDMLKGIQSETDQELDEYGIAPPLSVKVAELEEVKELRRIILEELEPSILIPVEKEGYMNARICLEVTDGKDEMLLQLVFFAVEADGPDRNVYWNVYWNGIELQYQPAFYRLLEVFSKDIPDIEGYFNREGQVRW